MNQKTASRANAAFKKTERALKPWEEAAAETARKTERLRALRLAKEAAEKEAEAKPAAKK